MKRSQHEARLRSVSGTYRPRMASSTNSQIELVILHESERSYDIVRLLGVDDVLSRTDTSGRPSIDALLIPFVA